MALLAALGAVVFALASQGQSGALASDASVRSITLRVGHVNHPGFSEEIALEPGGEAAIWDTPYSVRFAGYVPDFTMDTGTGEVRSRSNRPENPASLIELYEGETKVNEQWVVHAESAVHAVRAPGFVFQVVGME